MAILRLRGRSELKRLKLMPKSPWPQREPPTALLGTLIAVCAPLQVQPPIRKRRRNA